MKTCSKFSSLLEYDDEKQLCLFIMISSSKIQRVHQHESWLAEAAFAESSRLPCLDIAADGNDQQLILIRYVLELCETPFIYEDLKLYGAMWTDSITVDADETYKLVGNTIADQCRGVQVIRLGLPCGFQIPGEYDRDDVSEHLDIAMGRLSKAGAAKEFWLRFDIERALFANIPVEFDQATRTFVKPHRYAIPKPLTQNLRAQFSY